MVVVSWQLGNHFADRIMTSFTSRIVFPRNHLLDSEMSLLPPGTDWDGEALLALAWSEQRFSFS